MSDNNEADLFADAAAQILSDLSTPAAIRAIEAGGSPKALWDALEAAGFADALVPEASGGAGLALADVFGVWTLCGAHGLPVPLAETMIARALLASAGVAAAPGSIALAEGRIEADGELRCAVVRSGQVADSVLVQHREGWALLPAAGARAEPVAFCLDRAMTWSAAEVAKAGSASAAPAITLPAPLDLRTLHAGAIAALTAGALSDVFARTLQYANDRVQFGRPIGKFQAIQHQLAVMSEHVFAARMAAQLGCAGSRADAPWLPDRLRVAVAKARTGQAALVAAETSHSIHGAIGFTAEYDLQLLTRRLHAWRQTAGSEAWWQTVAGEGLVDGHAGLTLDLLRATTDPATGRHATTEIT